MTTATDSAAGVGVRGGEGLQVLTHSSMQCAKTCLRKNRLSYRYGIRRATDAKPLVIGRAGHEILDARRKGHADPINAGLAGYDASKPSTPELIYDWEIDRITIATLCAAYFWRWEEDDSNIVIVASELQFSMPLINPETGKPSRTYSLAGKMDAIISRHFRVGVMETKFIGQDLDPDSDYWKRLRIDSQISIYFDAAKHAGHAPDFILYDVIRKPTIRPKQIPDLDEAGIKIVRDANGERVKNKDGTWKQSGDSKLGYELQSRLETPEEYGERLRQDIGERPEFYFARREFARLEPEMIEARYDVWQTAQILRDCATHDRYPRNTGACITFGKCPMFDLCANGFDPDTDDLPEGYERVSNPHVELDADLLNA